MSRGGDEAAPRLVQRDLAELIESREQVIGFWGAPPREALREAARRHPGLGFFDLDVYHRAPESRVVPDAYCHVIRNCVDNALALGPLLRCAVAATGREKCDSARFAATVLDEISPAEVIATVNERARADDPPLLSEARGDLKSRVCRIMDGIVEPLDDDERRRAAADRCEPSCGFWGVPPHPIEVLDLFPASAHVFGWTRCVEQGRPADLELETSVPDGLPVVFFAQGFCSKAILAHALAGRHRGMYVDVHDSLHASTRAKIEAFIRLSGGEG